MAVDFHFRIVQLSPLFWGLIQYWKLNEMERMEKVRSYVRSARLRRKWLGIWENMEQRVLSLPEQMQEDLLNDVSEAVEGRVAVLERANCE